MKLGLVTMVIFGSLVFSCNKSDVSKTVPVNSFTYTYRGPFYSADVHFANVYSMARTPIIVAYNKANVRYPKYKLGIAVTSFSAGTYSLGKNRNNTGYYTDDHGLKLACTGGSLNITSKTDDLMPGNFTIYVTDPVNITRPIVGSFTNTPIKL
jgi:hypothetical protein